MSNSSAPRAALERSYPLLSVNVGAAREAAFKGKPAKSGIYKEKALGAVTVRLEGLSGDEQADTVNHGGPDKAVCAYPYRHYAFWEERLGSPLAFGAFGENFTIDEIDESEVCVGDIFKIGEVALQISQPRVPCWKLAMKWGVDELPALVRDTGKTGFYFRVLTPGEVEPGELVLVSRDPAGVTVEEANAVMHRGKADRAGMLRLHAVDALADAWRETLTARLSRLAQA
ncbi:MOSC domain-containing protein [Cohnella rhizosphaerae]|uniref:MOSC domain-containing protein n=1 Tax=Cohnella rhizosphaerae TaxID=1457232 RepID=A0A9X4QVT2_9BACL|nr:MOSC domain-containing protein [Cohnella rhizosphaerae]MDG0812909.1 MOSC domain-containing protein [Cohnella rhizosphaerae]